MPAGAAYEVADGVDWAAGRPRCWRSGSRAGPASATAAKCSRRSTTWASATPRVPRRCTRACRRRPSGRNLIPALEIFADIVLRPHLDDEEVEPIRALCLQNLRSLEDDPGTKVIYELRQRHFPEPWGRPSPGTTEGVAGLTPRRPPAVLPRGLPAQRGDPGRGRGDRLAPASQDAVGRLFGDWKPRPEPRLPEKPGRPEPRPHRPRDPADPDRAGLSRGHGRQPRLLSGPRRGGDPGGLLLGPALHRGPREARALLLGLRQLRGPARPGGRPLLRRHLDRSGPADPRRHARRAPPPGPRRGSSPRSSRRCGPGSRAR